MEPWITDELIYGKQHIYGKRVAELHDKMDVNYQAQLDMIPIEEIEKYLRKKKLEALKDEPEARR